MSIAGRTTLINSSLNNTQIYHMSIYLLSKTIIDKLDKTRRAFFGKEGALRRSIIWLDGQKFVNIKRKVA
jgi:hypothetical protein